MIPAIRLLSFVWNHPLNSANQWGGVGRVLRWQVLSRMTNSPVPLPFVEKTRLLAVKGLSGATGNWYCGLHEAEEMGFILHFLRPEELFVDIGANVGSYTVLAAGGVGARVVSIEPIPATFSILQSNVRLNDIEALVELHCIGLSSRRSELRFTTDRDTVNHVMTESEDGNSITVQAASLDEVLAGRTPSVMKIDVEGHERDVLIGGKGTLSDPGLLAVVMELNGSGARYGVCDDDLLLTMRRHGFEAHSYDPLSRKLRVWDPVCNNAIFLRNVALAQDRVGNARRFRLNNGMI